mgnify:CR=1 FL=1
MMRFIVVGGILATLSGCSSATTPGADSGAPGGDAGAAAPTCAARSGNYTLTETLVSGDCGPAGDARTFSITDGTQAYTIPYVLAEKTPPGKTGSVAEGFTCSGSVAVSADNCVIEYSIKCPSSKGGTFNEVGSIKWAADGKSAEQLYQIKLFSTTGANICTGDYSVAASK